MLRRLIVVTAMLVAAGSSLAAQGSSSIPPGAKAILTIDSAKVTHPMTSRDGKWVVFTRATTTGTSIWIASTTNPRPLRLTADGYRDDHPSVAPQDDRVFFISNRPGRDARAKSTYVMSIPIDNVTGKPTGPVRQVSTDTLAFLSPDGISPDGKWLAYAYPGSPATVRVVPTTGGNPRIVASRFSPGGLWTTFSADGQRVVFQDSGTTLIRMVSINGGRVTTVASAGANGLPLVPFPYSDQLYLATDTIGGQWRTEVRDLSGKTTRSLSMSADYSPWMTSPGGEGRIGVSHANASLIKRVMLKDGSISAVPSGMSWALGLLPDGSIVQSTRRNGREVIATSTAAGKQVAEVVLPAEVATVHGLLPGGSKMLAFGNRYQHVAVRNRFGIDTAGKLVPAYLVDRLTGALRKLADSVRFPCCPVNGGDDEGATGMAVIHAGSVEIQGIAGDGTVRLLRTFAPKEFDRISEMAIRGNRLAYALPTTTGHSDLWLSDGPTAKAVKLGSINVDEDVTIALAWSPDGKRIAVAYGEADKKNHAVAQLFDLSADGATAHAGPALELGGSTDYFENIVWLPDASALIVMRDDHAAKNCINCAILRPLDASRPATRLAPSLGSIGSFLVEPGGKSVLVSVEGVGGSTIWTAGFGKQ